MYIGVVVDQVSPVDGVAGIHPVGTHWSQVLIVDDDPVIRIYGFLFNSASLNVDLINALSDVSYRFALRFSVGMHVAV